jgi:hypothetical protein
MIEGAHYRCRGLDHRGRSSAEDRHHLAQPYMPWCETAALIFQRLRLKLVLNAFVSLDESIICSGNIFREFGRLNCDF